MSSIEQQNAAVQQECGACGAEAGEECAPLCLGAAAAQDEQECCDPCSAGEHADDGTGTPCQCCGAVCPEI